MSGILCSMVGATFTVAAAAEVLRSKKGITAVGNAQIDTAQSKFGGSSALSDGTGDFLLSGSTSSTDLVLSGDFTLEGWFRFNSTSGTQGIFSDRNGGYGTASNGYKNFYLEKNTGNGFYWGVSGAGDITDTGTSLVTTNTWYHIAVVRSGSTIKFYLDGVQKGSNYTYSSPIGSGLFYTGAIEYSAGSYYSVNGWIDEVRISNTARYTSNFTAPTTPFTNDANTLLLIHADGSDATTFFEDDNGVRSSKGIVAIGNAQVDTAQSKFGGSSLLLDGTGDYLKVPLASAISFGTGDFTVEGWFRLNTNTSQEFLFSGSAAGSIMLQKQSNGYRVGTAGISWDYTTPSTITFSTGTWYHFAVVRSSGTLKIYHNGVSQLSSSSSNTYNFTTDIWIGGTTTATQEVNGWMDEFRISNSARYTTDFTPSTSPFTNDSNTLLLLHMNGTDGSTFFEDDNGVRSQKSVVNSGGVVAMLGGPGSFTNATVSTTQSKFGGSSISLNGTDQFIMIPATFNNDFSFTGDFTLEAWIYQTANSSYRAIITNWESGIFWAIIGGNEIVFYGNGSLIVDATGLTISANTWYHLAVSRSGSSVKLWLNGSQVGTTGTLSGTINAADFTGIGCNVNNYPGGNVGSYFQGYLDEVRVSNSARYTSNFTAPTEPFVNDANTLLLMHMNQADGATIFRDDNTGTVTTEDSYTVPTSAFTSDALTVALWKLDNAGTDSSSNSYTLNTTGGYSSSVVKFGSYSGNLSDSTSDYFSHTTDRYFAPYNGSIMTDLTWECWVYYTSWTNASWNHASQNNPHPTLMCASDYAANRQSMKFGFSGNEGPYASGLLCLAAGDISNGNIDTITARGTTSFSLNTWYHIALTYNSLTGNVKGYVDGVKQFTKQAPDLGYSLPTHFTLGSLQSTNVSCYVDEVRISRTIRYGI